jgi:photosystem II stability/assembly factor-like uncharacterized protein
MNWIHQASGVDGWLRSVDFVDGSSGWAVGTILNGPPVIVHTTDGGNTWVRQDDDLPWGWFNSVDFINNYEGWAVGLYQLGSIIVITHTTDGGETWIDQESPVSEELVAVSFVDSDYGWAVGHFGTIVHTTNGGDTWIEQESGTSAFFTSVQFLDREAGWTVGGGGAVLSTSDGGTTWESEGCVTFSNLTAIHMIDRESGWIVGNDGVVFTLGGNGPTSAGAWSETPSSQIILSQNYPNPFNPTTTIQLSLPKAGDVYMELFDVLGRRVAVLVDRYLEAGIHTVVLDGFNLSAGAYFYRVRMRDLIETRRMILIR